MRRNVFVWTISLGLAPYAVADPGPQVASDSWPYTSSSDPAPLEIDGGLVVGFPAALPTGLSRGAGGGITRGRTWTLGARAAWVTATESTMAWTVTHSDLRLRLTGGVQHAAGRGAFGLRLALGGTLVHESRHRTQGERAGLTGDELATSAYAMLPAGDLEALVRVHVAGPWLLVVSGGPSVALVDGSARASWSAQLGVAWQP